MGIVLFHIDAIFRLAFSILILDLFEAVKEDEKTLAYIYVAVLSVIWYLSQLFKEHGLNKAYIVAAKIKSALAMLLYAKVYKMSSFVLRNSHQISRITNLVANDLTVMEQRAAILMHITVFPMLFVGVTIILLLRIGWPSLVGLAVLLLSIPLTIKISSINKEILTQVNIRKDKRVQMTN